MVRRYIKALGDYILDLLGQRGIYTYGLFGALVTRLDSFAQVVVIFLFSLYVVLRHKEAPETVESLAQFTAGYFLAEFGVQIGATYIKSY
jgi:hypothetical protein